MAPQIKHVLVFLLLPVAWILYEKNKQRTYKAKNKTETPNTSDDTTTPMEAIPVVQKPTGVAQYTLGTRAIRGNSV